MARKKPAEKAAETKDDGIAEDPDALSQDELAMLEAYQKGEDPPETAGGDNDDAHGDGDTAAATDDGGGGEGVIGGDEEAPDGGDAADGAKTEGDDDQGAAGDDANVDDDRPKTVPHAALHKEREQHKETRAERDALAAEISEWREKWARADERLHSLFAKDEKADKEAEKPDPEAELGDPPDPEEDIFGYIKWRDKKDQIRDQRLAELEGTATKTRTEIAEDKAAQALVQDYHADIRAFVTEQQDWGQAYDHLRQTRISQYRALGYKDDQIAAAFNEEEMGVLQTAREQNKRPAEVVYGLAVATGYKPAAEEAAQDKPNDDEGKKSDEAAEAKPNGKAKPKEKSKIDQLIEQEEAATSLSDVGGGGGAEITMEVLAAMSDDEFAEFADENPKAMKRMMGQ